VLSSATRFDRRRTGGIAAQQFLEDLVHGQWSLLLACQPEEAYLASTSEEPRPGPPDSTASSLRDLVEFLAGLK
jgi:hypothetical protein